MAMCFSMCFDVLLGQELPDDQGVESRCSLEASKKTVTTELRDSPEESLQQCTEVWQTKLAATHFVVWN